MSEPIETTAVPVPVQKPELALSEAGIAAPKSLEEQLRIAQLAIKSGLMPTSLKTPEQVLLVMQRGAELGFKAHAAIDYLYPVNGRVRLTPAGAKALALQSGLLADYSERVDGVGDERTAVVIVQRKGIKTPTVGKFSIADARRARLEKKDNWQSYQDRMLLARARGFAFMDAFADLVGGMQVRETYDLDPGEVVATEPAVRQIPAATPDPMLASLGVPQQVEVEEAK